MRATRLGPYRLLSELGSGGMGTVHAAEVVESALGLEVGWKVAIKVIHPHLLSSPGFFKRFLREAELGRRVVHENVVRTFDVDALMVDDTQVNYMVMEYVEGRSLRQLLKDLGKIPETLLREIALQTAAGLAAIHGHGIVHRDLKPENVLITDDHEIRIMDLGVAKLQEASLAITREGQFAGSVLYAAPEQFGPNETGPAADLYSLGVMLYELASGDNPFRRDEPAALIEAHLKLEPPRLTDLSHEMTPFFAELVAKLLGKQPADRFESAEALRAVLRDGERSAWWRDLAPKLRKRLAHLPKIQVRRDTKLHGREAELEVLHTAWEGARRGEGSTVFIEGEAGIGKTRVVDAFLRGLESKDIHVLYGSYPPSGGLGGISDAVIDKFGEPNLASALAPYLTETPTLVTAFAALVRHESPPSGAEALQGDALQAVAVHLMRALAEEKPTIWVVDDLQSAPRESRDLVLAMARAVEDHRLLLVVVTRPGLDVADFSRLDNFQRLDVGRLSPREVIHLLEDAFRSRVLADKLGAKIAVKSDGVPFFIFEMVRGLKEGEFIRQLPDGTYVQAQAVTEIEVPSAVKDLIEQRMRGLTENQRAILDAGAVQGITFDPELVASVVDERPIRVLRELAEIERRFGLVHGDGEAIRFDQAQIQEVLYGALLLRLRREYHSLLADAYAAGCGERPVGADTAFLAFHYLRGNRPQRALPHLEAAVAHLEKAYRNEGALDLAERALGVTGLLDGRPRVEMLLRMAGCFHLLGRREEERAALDQALALADEIGLPALRGQARCRLGGHLIATAQYHAAQTALREALEMASAAGDRELEAQATGSLGVVFLSHDRHEQAQGLLERQRTLAEELGNKRDEARATGNLGILFHHAGRHDDAQEYYERARVLFHETGDQRGEAIATGNLGVLFHDLGRLAEAREYHERYGVLAAEIGFRQGEAIARNNLAGNLLVFGQHDAAREHNERARALAREIGDRRSEGFALHGLAWIAERTGDLVESERLYEEALAVRREIGHRSGVAETLVGFGRLHAAQGRQQDAAALLDEALELGRALNEPDTVLLAAAHRAALPGGDAQAAVQALADHDAHIGVEIDARFALWEATRDREHLAKAHELLLRFCERAPEDFRETMTQNVPLLRDILGAWDEHGA